MLHVRLQPPWKPTSLWQVVVDAATLLFANFESRGDFDRHHAFLLAPWLHQSITHQFDRKPSRRSARILCGIVLGVRKPKASRFDHAVSFHPWLSIIEVISLVRFLILCMIGCLRWQMINSSHLRAHSGLKPANLCCISCRAIHAHGEWRRQTRFRGEGSSREEESVWALRGLSNSNTLFPVRRARKRRSKHRPD